MSELSKRDLLDSYNSEALWAMAQATGLPVFQGNRLRKDSLITLLIDQYFKPRRVRQAYKQL